MGLDDFNDVQKRIAANSDEEEGIVGQARAVYK
jgi:hypothetical protein